MAKIKIHLLRCGSIFVSPDVPYGGGASAFNAVSGIFTRKDDRVELPVYAYLVEHPKGLILVDTGWCRDVSPNGVYDRRAARRVLPGYLEALYQPVLPKGQAIHEQLSAMGVSPAELECVIITHLDPDHVSGVKHLSGAKRVILAEDEYFWSCRTVYKARQPWKLWIDRPMEHFWYRGTPIGPNHWCFDLFGDGSVILVNVPGHTDGMAAVLLYNGAKYVLLTADAAYSHRSWEELLVPGFGFDEKRQLKSLKWVREMAEAPECAAVFASHDPDVSSLSFEF